MAFLTVALSGVSTKCVHACVPLTTLCVTILHCIRDCIPACRGWDYNDPKIPGKPHIEYDVSCLTA